MKLSLKIKYRKYQLNMILFLNRIYICQAQNEPLVLPFGEWIQFFIKIEEKKRIIPLSYSIYVFASRETLFE